jgi:protein gp37
MAWEPWTGCYPASDGCKYCYFYGPYSKRCGQNEVIKTDEFYKPLETIYMPRKKITKYRIESGKNVNTCFTTDFFIPEADEWRAEAWSMMKQRPDLTFTFLTKRIDRFLVSLPDDWGDGYDNVRIGCTVENQETADYRLPLYISFPLKLRWIVCSPLLGKINLAPYLHSVENVRIGGESGRDARVCDYDWVLDIREQCKRAGVSFIFGGTGSHFRKDGAVQNINPYKQKSVAREMNINIAPKENEEIYSEST